MNWAEQHRRIGPLSVALLPLSALYLGGWEAYAVLYALRLKRPYRSRLPVVCVGNLVVGGTGKTPFTLALASLLQERIGPVAISLSGYGSPSSQGAQIAPLGSLDSTTWGDEPALFREALPDFPLIVGRDRVRAANLAENHFPGHLLLLDDGFQHLPLAKDVSILLRPREANPFCLPAGPYREPKYHERRAQFVVAEGVDYKRVYRCEPMPSGPVTLLCAVGNPSRVLESAAILGIEVRNHIFLPDHNPLSAPDLLESVQGPLLVTRKDWVKLKGRPDLGDRPIFVIDYQVQLEAPFAEAVVKLVQSVVNGKQGEAVSAKG